MEPLYEATIKGKGNGAEAELKCRPVSLDFAHDTWLRDPAAADAICEAVHGRNPGEPFLLLRHYRLQRRSRGKMTRERFFVFLFLRTMTRERWEHRAKAGRCLAGPDHYWATGRLVSVRGLRSQSRKKRVGLHSRLTMWK